MGCGTCSCFESAFAWLTSVLVYFCGESYCLEQSGVLFTFYNYGKIRCTGYDGTGMDHNIFFYDGVTEAGALFNYRALQNNTVLNGTVWSLGNKPGKYAAGNFAG